MPPFRILLSAFLLSCSVLGVFGQEANDYEVSTNESSSSSPDGTASPTSALSAEELFLRENFPYLSLCDWTAGMRFYVVPDDHDSRIHSFIDSATGQEVSFGALAGKILVYRGHELTERGWFALRFYCPDNQVVYGYQVRNYTFEDYCRRVNLGGVPGLAYLGDVDKARELLIGKELWLKVPTAYKDGAGSLHQSMECTLKADQHVLVEKVGVGTREYPVKIVFRTDDGELYYQAVAMSRTNSAMEMNDFSFGKEHHYFANAFGLTSLADMNSAKMAEQLKGKTVTLRRDCTMKQGAAQVNVKARMQFVVQRVTAIPQSSYYTLSLTSSGRLYEKNVTFEHSTVIGNINGNDESYFHELFTLGKKFEPSHTRIQRTYTVEGRSYEADSNSNSLNLLGGIISKGMSKADVQLAKGDPERRIKLKGGGVQWNYFDMKVQFGGDGRVKRIIRSDE